MTGSEFSGNAAQDGGALRLIDADSTVADSVFLNNMAGSAGGGIGLFGGSLTSTSTSFTGNTATLGGGVFTLFSAVSLVDSHFDANAATLGEAIDVLGGDLVLEASLVTNHLGTGAIALGPSAETITVDHTVFEDTPVAARVGAGTLVSIASDWQISEIALEGNGTRFNPNGLQDFSCTSTACLP